jgi:hypothetical protein
VRGSAGCTRPTLAEEPPPGPRGVYPRAAQSADPGARPEDSLRRRLEARTAPLQPSLSNFLTASIAEICARLPDAVRWSPKSRPNPRLR